MPESTDNQALLNILGQAKELNKGELSFGGPQRTGNSVKDMISAMMFYGPMAVGARGGAQPLVRSSDPGITGGSMSGLRTQAGQNGTLHAPGSAVDLGLQNNLTMAKQPTRINQSLEVPGNLNPEPEYNINPIAGTPYHKALQEQQLKQVLGKTQAEELLSVLKAFKETPKE